MDSLLLLQISVAHHVVQGLIVLLYHMFTVMTQC
jgi:hypothetical protein